MPITPDGPAPYAPPKATITVLEHHRDRGLPTPLNRDNVARIIESEPLAPRVLKALRLFDLIDNEGSPTDTFDDMAKARSDEEFKERLADVLRAAYADVFQYVDPAKESVERVEGQFRSYTPRGQQKRMAMLFRGLSEYAGILPAGSTATRRTNGQPGQPSQRRSVRKTGESHKPLGVLAAKREAQKLNVPRPPDSPEFLPSPEPATGAHPFIQGLIQMMPPAGTEWPKAKRQAWADAALSAFDVIYELAPDDRKGGE